MNATLRQELAAFIVSHTRLVAVVFILATAAALCSEGYYSYRAELRKAAETADNLSLLLGERFSADIGAVETMLSNSVDSLSPAIMRDSVLQGQLDSKTEGYLKRQFALAPVVDNFSVATADGKVIYSRVGNVGVQLDNLAVFRKLKDNPQLDMAFSSIYPSPASGLSVVSLARPLSRAGVSFAGIALSDLDLFYFQRLLLNINVGSYGTLTLLHENGQLVSSIPENPAQIGKPHLLPTAVGPKLESSLGWTALGRFPGESDLRMFSVRKLPGLPFTIAVGLSNRDFLASWRTKIAIHSAFILCLMLLTVAVERLLVRERRQTLVLRESERKVERNRQQLQTVIEAAPVALAIARFEDGRIMMSNHAMSEVVGRSRTEIEGRALCTFCPDAEAVALWPQQLMEQGFIGHREVEIRHSDGSARWLLIDATRIDFDGLPAVIMGGNDITARKILELKLVELASVDSLTGLANRRAFTERALVEFERARRAVRPLAVLMIDIDRFKQINDGHGHAAGDEIIRLVADKLGEVLRAIDVSGRLGGDEFAVLLPETTLDAAIAVGKRLCNAANMATLPQADGEQLRITISVGAAALLASDIAFDDLLKRADAGLYLAKKQGRNQVASDNISKI